MDTKREPLTPKEREVLEEALHAWRQQNISWLMDTFGHISFTLDILQMLSEAGCVIKFYQDNSFAGILLFDVGHAWWSKERICSEEFVLAAPGVHGLQRAAIRALEDIAEEYGAKLIVSGNIFQANNNLIGNGYKKHGFRQACATYAKEVKDT